MIDTDDTVALRARGLRRHYGRGDGSVRTVDGPTWIAATADRPIARRDARLSGGRTGRLGALAGLGG